MGIAHQFKPETSTRKMNPLSPPNLFATLMCALAATKETTGLEEGVCPIPVYRYYKPRTDHLYTTSLSEIGVSSAGMVGKDGYKFESIGFRILASQPDGSDWDWELVQPSRDVINSKGGRIFESHGLHFRVKDGGTTSMARYWDPVAKDHFYTTDDCGRTVETFNEHLLDPRYELEGFMGFCYCDPAPGTVPLYQYHDREFKDHFYTTDFSESVRADFKRRNDERYSYQGVLCHVFPTVPTEAEPETVC